MRTTLDIDPDLVEEVVKATGQRTKSRAVNEALEDYIRWTRLNRLLEAPGRITLDDSWQVWRSTELGRLREFNLDDELKP